MDNTKPFKPFAKVVLVVLALVAALLVTVAAITACCKDQPVHWPERPTIHTCTLPPSPKLPAVELMQVGCPKGLVCLNYENAAKLATREDAMKSWIQEVKIRCTAGGAHE